MEAVINILFIDIETKPMLVYSWGTFKQNISINQIKEDWQIISYAAKWKGKDKIFYCDMRKQKTDKKLVKQIWKLLDKADVIVTQNGISFDQKKINARFIEHNMKPTSSYKHIDTYRIAKKHFAFSSNKLEWMASILNKKHFKMKTEGFELWKGCMNDELNAWKKIEKYNKADILALEELYYKLYPWDNKIDFMLHTGKCHCGSYKYIKKGFALTEKGKYQRYKCTKCGSETRDGKNLLK